MPEATDRGWWEWDEADEDTELPCGVPDEDGCVWF